jgi:PAS domain S-box-containing protein
VTHEAREPSGDLKHQVTELEAENAQLRHELAEQKALVERSEQLAAALEGAGIGVWSTSLQTEDATANGALPALYGLPAGTFFGFRRWLAHLHPDDRARVEREGQRALETGSPYFAEFRIIRADTGEVRWIQARGHKVTNAKEGGYSFVGINVDITDMKDVEAARHEQSARLRATYESAPVGLCLVDHDLRYLEVNRRLAEINGVPVQQHIGRTMQEVIPDIAGFLEPIYRRVLETGEPFERFLCAGTVPAHPDEQHEWLTSCYPVRSSNGSVTSISVSVVDVTDLRKTQEDLRKALDTAQAADRAKARFIAAMNHEFRTPISIVMGYAEMLSNAAERGEVVKDKARHLVEIYEASRHLLQLVEDATRYANLSLSEAHITRVLVPVERLVRQAVQAASSELSRSAVTVDLPQPGGGPEIKVDVAMMREGLASLLREVARRAPPSARVEVSWRDADAEVAIEMLCGALMLSVEVLEQLRAPLDHTALHTRGLEGAGFGLAIAESAVRVHGGSLLAKSSPDAGTHFLIQLPLV